MIWQPIRKRTRGPTFELTRICFGKSVVMLFSWFDFRSRESPRGYPLPEIPPPHCRAAADESRRRTCARGCCRSPSPRDRPARSRWGLRTAAPGLPKARLRERRSGPTAGRRNFSSLQSIENKRNRIGIPLNSHSRSGEADATAATLSPNQKESRQRVHPRRSSRKIGASVDVGGEIFLSANPRKGSKRRRNLVGCRSSRLLSRKAASDTSGCFPQGRPRPV
jgi:hypothetical protein